jgi:phosphohistidine phosphatase SixA
MASLIGRLGMVILIAGLAVGAVPTLADDTGAALLQTLRAGGHVLYLRHFGTDPTQADTDTLHLENCAAQRQLSEAGRAQATAFGEALRRLQVPVGQVIVSRYCRAIDTARLAGFAEITTTLDVSEAQNVSQLEGQRRAAALRALLAAAPAAGSNTLIVSHRPNLLDATGKEFFDIGEGEVVVFQPIASAPFYQAIGRVKPASWTEWAQAAPTKP